MPESSQSAIDASRQVGEAELTPRPTAVPKVMRMEDTAEAVRAPRTIGDHSSRQPSGVRRTLVLVSVGPGSMTVMAIHRSPNADKMNMMITIKPTK